MDKQTKRKNERPSGVNKTVKLPRLNQKTYTYYVVMVATGLIETGWEYKSDAEDHAKEMAEFAQPVKVKHKSTLHREGIDPDLNENWQLA